MGSSASVILSDGIKISNARVQRNERIAPIPHVNRPVVPTDKGICVDYYL